MAPSRSPSPSRSSRRSSPRRSTLSGGIQKRSKHQPPVLSAHANFSDIVPGGVDQSSPSTKTKGQKKSLQKLEIESKLMACVTCVAGHRVGYCRHTDRPFVECGKPGRPKNGETATRGETITACKCRKCTCVPGTSPCTCGCKEKPCVCIKRIYLIVYHGTAEDQSDDGADVDGKSKEKKDLYRITKRYFGNADGEEWPEDHLRKHGVDPDAINQKTDKETTDNQTTDNQKRDKQTTGCGGGGGGCGHQTAVARANQQAPRPQPVNNTQHDVVAQQLSATPSATPSAMLSTPAAGAIRRGCNCGPRCSCTFCPQHPNTGVTRASAHEMLCQLFIAGQLEDVSQDVVSFTPQTDLSSSCMSQQHFGVSTQLPPANGEFWSAYPVDFDFAAAQVANFSTAGAPLPMYQNMPDLDTGFNNNGFNDFTGEVDFFNGAFAPPQNDPFNPFSL